MLKRTITGAVYVLTVVGFFLLREYVDRRLFDILTAFFCAVGTFEVARAVKSYLYKGNFALSVVYGCAFVPLYCVTEYFTGISGALVCAAFAAIFASYQAVLAAVKEKNVDGANFIKTFRAFCVNVLPFLYPSLLLLSLLLANDLPFNVGKVCLITIFVVSPASDTFAYLVGMSYNKIRKGKAKKMCPVLSPKKTWAGAIGGVIGGVIGGLIVYLIFGGELTSEIIPLSVFFAIAGFIGSILTEIGDLFESYIKRKVGIKDMGRIMPGHGGITDRIDGMSFAAVFVYFMFLIFIG